MGVQGRPADAASTWNVDRNLIRSDSWPKIDLVMWTFNGESTIERSLNSIAEAVPSALVCHRYLVDGGSTDRTREIAKKLGWTPLMAHQRGIPFQANQALELIDTPVFASFEQDIGVNSNWFKVLMPRLLSTLNVAVVQGLRAASGSEYLEAIDSYSVRHGLVPPWVYSIDNNLCRTDAVRSVGGYPLDCPTSTDGALRDILFQNGWKWRVYQDLVSEHYRDSFRKHLKHVVMQSAVGKVLWETYPEYPMNSKLGRFLATPLTAAKIASESHHPGVFVAYPLLRGVKALSRVIGSLSKKYQFIEVRTQP
jgi:glycosyltransferase involved in cell wall biosynthesis